MLVKSACPTIACCVAEDVGELVLGSSDVSAYGWVWQCPVLPERYCFFGAAMTAFHHVLCVGCGFSLDFLGLGALHVL